MPDLPIPEAGHDILTPRALSILREGGESTYRALVVRQPSPLARRLVGGLQPQDLLARPIKHEEAAKACVAGLWLWLDALDESHVISQALVSNTGSFWHAIMHRREADFSNSKYWYARCGNHHVMKLLGAVATSLAGDQASDPLVAAVVAGEWDAAALVDLVEAVQGKPSDPRHEVAVRLQRAEWEALFDYCAREAVEADVDRLSDWDKRITAPPSS